MKRKILVVDDEKNIVDIITFNLKKDGYDVICAYDGEKGLELARAENPELVILDIMMPAMDGFEVCKEIRRDSQVPIIMLTARSEEIDKVLGLELGADDYVTKPFSIRELSARVKANLRRTESTAEHEISAQNGGVLTFDGLTIDLNKYEVKRGENLIDITNREFELIKFLALNNTQVVTREMLLKEVWGYEFYGDNDLRTIDVTVRRLRMKVEENPDKPRYILTKRGVGYCFGG